MKAVKHSRDTLYRPMQHIPTNSSVYANQPAGMFLVRIGSRSYQL